MSVLGRMISIDQSDSNDINAVDIHLLDETWVTIAVNVTTKCKHVVMMVAKKIGIQNDADFALFQHYGNLSTGVTRLLEDQHFVLNVLTDWQIQERPENKHEAAMVADLRLLFKRRFYLPWSPFELEVDSAESPADAAHRYAYLDTIHHVMRGAWPCSEKQAIGLAALRVLAEFGTCDGKRHKATMLTCKIPELIPPLVRSKAKDKALAKSVFKVYSSLTESDQQDEESEGGQESQPDGGSPKSWFKSAVLGFRSTTNVENKPEKKEGMDGRLLAEQRILFTAQCWWPYFGAAVFPVTYMRSASRGVLSPTSKSQGWFSGGKGKRGAILPDFGEMAQMVVAIGHGGIYLLRPEGARKPKYGTCIIANYKYEDVDRCMMSKFKRGVCFWTADNITHFLLSDEDRAKELESLIRIYLSEFRAITEGEGSSVYDRMPQETTLKVITEGEEDADGNENSTESLFLHESVLEQVAVKDNFEKEQVKKLSFELGEEVQEVSRHAPESCGPSVATSALESTRQNMHGMIRSNWLEKASSSPLKVESTSQESQFNATSLASRLARLRETRARASFRTEGDLRHTGTLGNVPVSTTADSGAVESSFNAAHSVKSKSSFESCMGYEGEGSISSNAMKAVDDREAFDTLIQSTISTPSTGALSEQAGGRISSTTCTQERPLSCTIFVHPPGGAVLSEQSVVTPQMPMPYIPGDASTRLSVNSLQKLPAKQDISKNQVTAPNSQNLKRRPSLEKETSAQRAERQRRKLKRRALRQASDGLPAPWQAAYDNIRQEAYFFHPETGETRWDKPC